MAGGAGGDSGGDSDLTGLIHRWARRVLAAEGGSGLGESGAEGWLASEVPCSFVYGGRPAAALWSGWSHETSVDETTVGRTVWTVRRSDHATGLVMVWEATTYADSPAIDWIVTFRNAGATDTPILESVRALDLVLATDYHDLVVHHATGGHPAPDAFQPHESVLARRAPFRLASVGGRSSNGCLPYFNVEACWHGYRGLVVAVGWSGQWEAEITRFGSAHRPRIEPDLRGPNAGVSGFRAADRLRIQAGMEGVHLTLRPGEQIRTPRILLIPWQHDRLAGQNGLRRFIQHQVAPRLEREPPLPASWCSLGIVGPNEATLGAGYTHAELAALGASLPVECVLIDAGWYTPPSPPSPPAAPTTLPDWARSVGNYTVRRDLFPEGLQPISRAVREAGTRFGLWFEPERVYEGTEVFAEHPDFLYPTPLPHGHVLNLGSPAARDWITGTISRLIGELGVGWYRHDANADYLPVWRANDPPERQGISEIRHVEGLYRFWGDLLDRHPGLHIEGCASGGRRMDFEALRYHHSYSHTDWMVGDPAGMQSIVHGASQWLPGAYLNNFMGEPAAVTQDTRERRYAFWSAIGGGLMYGWRVFNAREPVDLDLARQWMEAFREVRHLTVGDFYPLLPHTNSEGEWAAAQYDRPDLGEGLIVAFRRRSCPVVGVALYPRGVDPAATYTLRYQSTGEQRTCAGRDLVGGMRLALTNAPAHEVVRYRRLTPGGTGAPRAAAPRRSPRRGPHRSARTTTFIP